MVANTADDIWVHGLKVSPDLDTVMYTLGGGIDESQGWGRDDETHAVQGELAAYGVQPQWFGLGDRDFGTHIARSQMLDLGYPLSRVTEVLCERWGLPDQHMRLIPMTDDPVETHVIVEGADIGSEPVSRQELCAPGERIEKAPPERGVTESGRWGSNPRPSAWEADALPTELRPRTAFRIAQERR